ncbi:hypothetical protein PISMIDRAFT_686213 [Pisolithus microcarpus 441]|uniref:Uncharacterized protein n=1 Tax=Pisolithus microcarpus 441 TaxID=765257 RepID=A0A0C9YIQ8_9AGAM|nr:hypothetical protein PISMIDRAFT_686213 [Pisolithus microcarpus 441]
MCFPEVCSECFFLTNGSDLFEIRLESGFGSRTEQSSNNASLLATLCFTALLQWNCHKVRLPPAFGYNSTSLPYLTNFAMTLSWPSASSVTFVLYEGA